MTDANAKFTGEIPKNYDAGLGAVIFAPYAEDIAARTKALSPATVLELAAGTGIVTRALRDALPASTTILATDLNDAMLDVARPHFSTSNNVSFEVVDAMAIPAGDSSFDLMVCQFGVMFFPDKVASCREALRVLKPGGTYLLSAWDSWTANPWAEHVHNTVAQFFEGDPPAFYKVPFHYHDEALIKRDLEDAGFVDVKIEHLAMTGKITSHESLANAAIFGNPIADEIRALDADVTPEQARDAVRDALVERFGPAPTTMPMAAFVVSSQKPDGNKKGFLSRLFSR